MFKKIPTYIYDTGTWTYTEFQTRSEFVVYLWSLFKEPGQYEFDECSLEFNKLGRFFTENKYYCKAPFKSKDFTTFWETEKEKNTEGVIYRHKDKSWYLAREYYMVLNFLSIFNKEKSKFGFPDVRDVQYHIALYEALAEYSYKHVAILKKRQCMSSYLHAAKIINHYWFDEGYVIKIGASLKDYINEKGIWRYLEEYRNFLNRHTAWYRPSNPDKVLNWEQKIEITEAGRKYDKGLKSTIIGVVLDKNPTAGVGGVTNCFYHEEGGIAPRMNETIEYLLPALKSGLIYTGMFIAAGSVGDLEQCEPLKKLIYRPNSGDVLAIRTNLVDAKGTISECGLFIPEQWGMPPCIDKYGNSLVEEALIMLEADFAKAKEDKTPQDYQLYVSQHPRNIEEAFANRKLSVFPQHLVTQQIRRIEDKEYYEEYVDLERNADGSIEIVNSNKIPISEFPISPTAVDKEGVIQIFERPPKNSQFGLHYASIDPVAVGKTTSTKSLISIYIYRNTQEITKHKASGEVEHIIEPGRIVACWCGRFDDPGKNHERLLRMLELYNAWAIVENNVSGFIQFMIENHKQKYLVPKNQMAFLKELSANTNVFQEYGWRNVGRIFYDNLIPYALEFLEEHLDEERKPDGEIVKTKYGIERIPDKMLLKEMQAFYEGLNVDRLISFCALAAFVRIQSANRGISNRVEREDNLQSINKNINFNMRAFKHVGRNSAKRPFRNLK
jgi:hypothetical protein